MREIQTRWGRRNLGFAWLFAEPLVFALPVIFMWMQLRAPFEHGLPMVGFVWSGYLPLLIFRHVTGNALYVIRGNAAMLYHKSVTPLDIVVGRCGLEMIGNLAATLFTFMIFYTLGLLDWPVNIPMLITGMLYMAWWAFCMALFVAALCERTDIVEHVWPPISYMYMPVSGFFFLASWLPTPIRGIALTVMPSLHAYEMIRVGLWGTRFEAYYDVRYLTTVLAVLMLAGLWLVRDTRRYVEID